MTRSQSLDDLVSVALLSNGASRIVSPYGLTDWTGVMEVLGAGGPDEVIRGVRQAPETQRLRSQTTPRLRTAPNCHAPVPDQGIRVA